MQKIMFNDRYGLTAAVLEGRKTMTRRIIPHQPEGNDWEIRFYNFSDHRYEDDPMKDPYFGSVAWQAPDGRNTGLNKLRWLPGEVVAIAQAYKDVQPYKEKPELYFSSKYLSHGWSNKMFVRADLMPHHIKITDFKLERLQDISDDDCLQEGIYPIKIEDVPQINETGVIYYSYSGVAGIWETPREAFASLIGKVSGKGTWESNPLVFCYEFELID